MFVTLATCSRVVFPQVSSQVCVGNVTCHLHSFPTVEYGVGGGCIVGPYVPAGCAVVWVSCLRLRCSPMIANCAVCPVCDPRVCSRHRHVCVTEHCRVLQAPAKGDGRHLAREVFAVGCTPLLSSSPPLLSPCLCPVPLQCI